MIGVMGNRGRGRTTGLYIDEFTNAIDYLRVAYDFLTSESPFKWKWITIGISNALYGLMICVFSGSDQYGALHYPPETRRRLKKIDCLSITPDQKHLLQYRIRESCADTQRLKVQGFTCLFSRLRKADFLQSDASDRTLDISESDAQRVLALRRSFRDRFEHFRSISILYAEGDFLPGVRATAAIVDQLLRTHDVYARGYDSDVIKRAQLLSRQFLAALTYRDSGGNQ